MKLQSIKPFLSKSIHLIVTLFLRLVKFVLLIVGLLFLVALFLFGLKIIVDNLLQWNRSTWPESTAMILLGIVVIFSTPLMMMRFFENRPWAKRMIHWYRPKVTALMGYILTPYIIYGVTVMLVLLFAVAWAFILYFKGQAEFTTSGSWYLIGTLVIVTISLFGHGLYQWAFRKTAGPNISLPRLFDLFRPSLVRIGLYVFLALAYFLSRLENFANVRFIEWEVWGQFREVIVEILLTYVAVDGAFVAFRDHRQAIVARESK